MKLDANSMSLIVHGAMVDIARELDLDLLAVALDQVLVGPLDVTQVVLVERDVSSRS